MVLVDAVDLNGGRGGTGGGISDVENVVTPLMIGLGGCDVLLTPSFL
jgi:hypothetical protein